MRETQQTINEWQDRMFPNATREGVTKHLIEELDELKEKLEELNDPNRKITLNDVVETGFEAADTIILIYAWAKKNSIDDFHRMFVDAKMDINHERDWNIQPDGTGRHK